jgi:hypothetical protein
MSLIGLIINLTAKGSARRFEAAAKDPFNTQRQLLMDIVRKNANTEYGKRYDFANIKSIEDYQQKVPIISYDDIADEMERISMGEKNVMIAEEPVFLAQTSGTTGKPKFIPVSPSCLNQAQSDLFRTWLYHARKEHRDIFDGKIMSLVSPAVEGHTDAGIAYGAASGHIYKSMPAIIKPVYSMPYEVFEIEDYESKYYVLMRVGLEQDVRFFATANPSSILKLCEKADEYKAELIEDIRQGTLKKDLVMLDSTRALIEKKLKPNPRRADELSGFVNRRGGKLLPGDYWPNMSLIGCWKGGTVGHYLDKFPEWFDPDNKRPVATRDWGFLSSEARCSVPLSDEGSMGALSVAANFYEFADADEVASNPDDHSKWTFYTADQLEKNRPYYIFLTTTGGLYRYDINDVIEVEGYYHNTPQIKFLRKGRGMTNITGEKVSVNQVIDSIQKASQQSGVLVNHFKAEADTENSRYVLRVEPIAECSDEEYRQLLHAFEDSLRKTNIEYEQKRKSQRLGSPVLHVMREGWYERRRKEEVAGGKRVFQSKTELLSPIKADTQLIKPELVKTLEL